MSYTELTIADQKIGIRFGLPAIRQIGAKMQAYELFSGDSYNELGLAHILYAGYCNECVINDKVPSVPFNQFYTFVETAVEDKKAEEIVAAIRVFEASKQLKEAVSKVSQEQKKRAGKKSTLTK